MYKKFCLLLIVFIFYLITASQVFACSCAGPRSVGASFQACGVYWSAEVIFIGKVTKITYEEYINKGKKYRSKMLAHLSVDKAVRGVNKGETIVIQTSPSTASCGFGFKEGEDYFVYQKRGKDGKFTEYLCGATVNLKYAQADLEYLKALENGETGGRIYGNVNRLVGDLLKSYNKYEPLTDITVTLKSVRPRKSYLKSIGLKKSETPKYKKVELTATTDDKGFYVFKDIPFGFYEVAADLPRELRKVRPPTPVSYRNRKDYYHINREKNRCSIKRFSVTSLPNLSGKIVDENGQMPPQQYLSLHPIDENGKAKLDSNRFWKWTDKSNGEFFFSHIPPGKYLLAVNPKGCPSNRYKGFGKMFYPGVRNESDAQIITVDEYIDQTLGDFQILPKLKEIKISGMVVDEDGKPFPKAKVLLMDNGSPKCRIYSSLSETFTDEEGKFTLTAYENYEYKIRAFNNKRGNGRLLSDLIDVTAKDDIKDLELILSKPR